MSKNEELKPFSIILNLTDEEHKQLAIYAGKSGLNIAELLQAFIADLVGSNRRNGSDEQDCASAWYDRCGFSWFPPKTLISYFCGNFWHSMDDFMDILESIEDIKFSLAETQNQIENIEKEYLNYNRAYKTIEDFRAYLLEDLADMENTLSDENAELKEIQDDFKEYMGETAYNWDDECKKFIAWYKTNVTI